MSSLTFIVLRGLTLSSRYVTQSGTEILFWIDGPSRQDGNAGLWLSHQSAAQAFTIGVWCLGVGDVDELVAVKRSYCTGATTSRCPAGSCTSPFNCAASGRVGYKSRQVQRGGLGGGASSGACCGD
jgi:hypothetical protein